MDEDSAVQMALSNPSYRIHGLITHLGTKWTAVFLSHFSIFVSLWDLVRESVVVLVQPR